MPDFTKSGAKCVSDMMTRKMRNQYRASALPFCLNNFFGIVGFVNSFDCTVDYAGFMDNSVQGSLQKMWKQTIWIYQYGSHQVAHSVVQALHGLGAGIGRDHYQPCLALDAGNF